MSAARVAGTMDSAGDVAVTGESDASVGGRATFPMTLSRIALCGARWMTLQPTFCSSSFRKKAATSTGPLPQLPVTTVVTPCVR